MKNLSYNMNQIEENYRYFKAEVKNKYTTVKQMEQSKDISVGMKKTKRMRSAFTTDQVNYLEKKFKKCPYVDSVHRKDVATALNITERAVKIWFQNRRMKEKKDCNSKECLNNHELQKNTFFIKDQQIRKKPSVKDTLHSLPIVNDFKDNGDQESKQLPNEDDKRTFKLSTPNKSSALNTNVPKCIDHNGNNLIEEHKQNNKVKSDKIDKIQQNPMDLSIKTEMKLKEDKTVESKRKSQNSESYIVPGIFHPINVLPLLKRETFRETKSYYEPCELGCSCKCHTPNMPVMLQNGSIDRPFIFTTLQLSNPNFNN